MFGRQVYSHDAASSNAVGLKFWTSQCIADRSLWNALGCTKPVFSRHCMHADDVYRYMFSSACMSGSMIANRQDFVQGPHKLSEVVCAVRQTFSSGVRLDELS